MDQLTLEVAVLRRGAWTTSSIDLVVNGVALAELARRVELPLAQAEGHESLAGSYSPLTIEDIHGDRDHFLGRPRATWFAERDTVLLGCDCGEWGCWPLTATVTVAPEVIRWSNFRQGHRTWDLSGLGPFEFGRTAYESALTAIP